VSGFLLDTNVLSEPVKRNPNPGLLDWLAAASNDSLYISVVTLGEIRRGIDRLGVSKRKAALEGFLEDLTARFFRRTHVIDVPVAERWGRLVASLESQGRRLPTADALIAATALEHNLTIVSRDADFYAVAGVSKLNPFS
jgi:predicted nucleic acid-binding protein